MKHFTPLILVLFMGLFSFASAKDIAEKGNFGTVVHNNFVTFKYVLNYLGESYKEGNVAFRLEMEYNKGYDIPSEINEEETILKNRDNDEFKGTVERKDASTAILLFPMDDAGNLGKRFRFYTEVLNIEDQAEVQALRNPHNPEPNVTVRCCRYNGAAGFFFVSPPGRETHARG